MLDTKARCWHQDFCGCQAMADQAFQGLFCQGHILLQPSQGNGIVETGWTVLQTSSSPAGSITLMGPWPLVLLEKHSIVSGQRDAIKPQQAFLFELPPGLHPSQGICQQMAGNPWQRSWLATEILASCTRLLSSSVPCQQQKGLLPALLSLPQAPPHLCLHRSPR